jgi:nitroreductase
MLSQTKSDGTSIFRERHSVRYFDPSYSLSEQEIKDLLKLAGSAPSSWNLQHWKFVVINTAEAKERLLPIARNQKQVVDASVTIAVLGDLEANRNAEAVYRPIVQAGLEDTYAGYASYPIMIGQIESAYGHAAPTYRRDEAIRNASLAAMQLMLAAKAKGFDSGPMVGFNADAFVEEFNVPPRYVPILLIAIGKALKPARPTTRFSTEQTIVWNGFDPDAAS